LDKDIIENNIIIKQNLKQGKTYKQNQSKNLSGNPTSAMALSTEYITTGTHKPSHTERKQLSTRPQVLST
jgi:hypothetical protein